MSSIPESPGPFFNVFLRLFISFSDFGGLGDHSFLFHLVPVWFWEEGVGSIIQYKGGPIVIGVLRWKQGDPVGGTGDVPGRNLKVVIRGKLPFFYRDPSSFLCSTSRSLDRL